MATVAATAGTRPGPRGGMPEARIREKRISEAAKKEYPARKNGETHRRSTFTEKLYVAWLIAPSRARGNQNMIMEGCRAVR